MTKVVGNVVHSGPEIAFSLTRCIIYGVEDSVITKPANAIPRKPPHEMMVADMLHPVIYAIQIERLFAIGITDKLTRELWPVDGYVSTCGPRQETMRCGKIYPGETDDVEDKDLAESKTEEHAEERWVSLLAEDKASGFLESSMRTGSELPVARYLDLLR